MPKGGFQVDYVQDPSGDSLSYKDISQGSFYGIDVTLRGPIVLNQPNSFLVYAIVPGMVSQDPTNPGNVGMSFYPTTFSSASGSIGNVRVRIVLPEGVTSSDVKYPENMPFDNVLMVENNIAVYWERSECRMDRPSGFCQKPGCLCATHQKCDSSSGYILRQLRTLDI